MDNKVLAGIAVVVLIAAVAVAGVMMMNNDGGEDGRVTVGVNYHGNGGATSDGKTVYGYTMPNVQPSPFSYDGHCFTGWNTKADGSGTAYKVGDPISYGSGAVDLYAQWVYSATFGFSDSSSGGTSGLSFYVGNAEAGHRIGVNAVPLPSDGSAIFLIEGGTDWTYDEGSGSFTGKSNGKTVTVTVTMDGAENIDPRKSGSHVGWYFEFSGPITGTIHTNVR